MPVPRVKALTMRENTYNACALRESSLQHVDLDA
jgi:hypothetical protein